MSYDSIINKNREYKDLQTHYNEILDEERNKLVSFNNDVINKLNLELLDYKELESLIDIVKHNISEEIYEKLEEVYLTKKPYKHEVIYKIDCLSSKKRAVLDANLTNFKNHYINTSFWLDITLNKNTQDKIISILLSENIITKHNHLYCSRCHNYIDILNERDLEYMKTITDLKNRIEELENDKTLKHTDELVDLLSKYYSMSQVNDPLYTYCCECDNEMEFKTLDEMLKYSKEIFYII